MHWASERAAGTQKVASQWDVGLPRCQNLVMRRNWGGNSLWGMRCRNYRLRVIGRIIRWWRWRRWWRSYWCLFWYTIRSIYRRRRNCCGLRWHWVCGDSQPFGGCWSAGFQAWFCCGVLFSNTLYTRECCRLGNMLDFCVRRLGCQPGVVFGGLDAGGGWSGCLGPKILVCVRWSLLRKNYWFWHWRHCKKDMPSQI